MTHGSILITGGSGFIGSWLCKKFLSLGYNVINVDNFNDFYDYKIKIYNTYFSINIKINYNLSLHDKYYNISQLANCIKDLNNNYNLYILDIVNYDDIKKIFLYHNNIKCIIHLASLVGIRDSIKKKIEYYDNNIQGTLNLLELIKLFKIKNFIYSSSSSVYGNSSPVPFSEDMKLRHVSSPYAYTKLNSEILLHIYHCLYDINVIILRFFNVYGPRQRPDLVIYKFTNLILENKKISFYNSALNDSLIRDYTYIDDIIDGILKSYFFLCKKKYKIYEIFNLGTGVSVPLSQIIKILEFFLLKKAKIKLNKKFYFDLFYTCANINKAKNMINYNPKTNIIKGIYRFINWSLKIFNKNEKNNINDNA